jgi:hypothetical protein
MVPIFVAMVFSFPNVYVTTLPGQYPDWFTCEAAGYSTRVAPGLRDLGLTSSKTDMIMRLLSIFIQMEPMSWGRANKRRC